MFKAESELEATPTHREPFRAAEKQPSTVEQRPLRLWMPQCTQVSMLIFSLSEVLSHICECEPNTDESR